MAGTPGRSFVADARLVGVITLGSRLLGLGREMLAAAAFGAGPVWSAFTLAFTIPNLFRKLFGEGAISAAFMPMYSRLRADDEAAAATFAASAVKLQAAALLTVVVVGEAVLLALLLGGIERGDYRLAAILTMIMLPYVVLICGAAFLGGILNVHGRFAAPAAASVLLNFCLIGAIGGAWLTIDLSGEGGRSHATIWLAAAVVVSGVAQVALLWPGLVRSGVRLTPRVPVLTDQTRRMLVLTVPVALSASLLQVGVLLDKGIAFFLAAAEGEAPSAALPMATGAAARLNWAQFLYQFPLGIFAIALATAIFPALSREAAAGAGRNDAFRGTVRRGVEAALYIGLPASVGLVLVAEDATAVLFERGRFTPFDTKLTAASVAIYSAGVWAFSLQQIVNRGWYALQEARVPLIWSGVNLAMNLAIELPLIWLLPRPFGEVGMAVGTLTSFSVQSLATLWLLSRRVGGLGLRQSVRPVAVMLLGCGLMTLACWPVLRMEAVPAVRLGLTMLVGGGVYVGVTHLLRVHASIGRGG
jgi:putative peptidoglycan lipid II flippase